MALMAKACKITVSLFLSPTSCAPRLCSGLTKLLPILSCCTRQFRYSHSTVLTYVAALASAADISSQGRHCNSYVAELRGTAEESLKLLSRAIYDERFPALFELDLYGSIVGMFELNNLGTA